MNLGLPLTFSLESAATVEARNSASLIEDIFNQAIQANGFSKEHLEGLATCAKALIGINFKMFTAKHSNMSALLQCQFNTGASTRVDLNPRFKDRTVEAIRKEGAEYKTQIKGVLEYDAKRRKFSGEATRDLIFYVSIGVELLTKLSARELTALLLHEIGHVWFQLRSSLVFVERSAALQEALLSLADEQKERIDMRKYLLAGLDKTVHRELYKKIEQKKATGTDYLVASILIKPQDVYAGSLQGSDVQRDEQAADYFASGFGYTEDLFTGLKRMRALPMGRDTRLHDMVELTAVGLLGYFFPITIPFSVLGMFMLNLNRLSEEKSSPYDRPELRAKRMITNLRGTLKRTDGLSTDFIKHQLNTLDRIEREIESQKDIIPIWGYLNPFYLRTRWSKRQEEDLEYLVNNPLFTMALKFKLDI